MKINQKLCWIITFGRHWFKYYSGENRYIQCRLCGHLPKSMWEWFCKYILKKKCNIEDAIN